MNRGIWIAVALLAAAPVLGQDQAKKTSTAKTPATKQSAKKAGAASKEGAKKPDESGSSAWGTGGAAKESVARKPTATTTAAPKHAAERATMLRLRSTFRYSVESCDRQGKACDGSLREDAEHRFMDGCLACATREQCEAERDVIRGGSSKSVTSLCSD